MASLQTAIADLIPSSTTLSPAEVLETRASSLRRLATLLRLARGAWALAVYESGEVQRLMVAELRRAVAPLSVVEVSLARETPDPLRIVRRIDPDGDAPIVSFHAIGQQMADLAGFLDIQRDVLAGYPHRLVFWASERDRRLLAQAAPNFYSRLSGVFYFPGAARLPVDGASIGVSPSTAGAAPASQEMASARRRLYLPVQDEQRRSQLIDFLQRRIRELRSLPRPNFEAIGDAWYDLAGVYETSLPRRWLESESAYAEAARAYAQAGLILAEAEARYQAGDAAMRGYVHLGALEHLTAALRLYRLLADSARTTPEAVTGEANVLKAQGDVLAFLDQRDEALARYQEALTLFRAVGDRLGEANVLKAQGDVLYFLKQTDEALARYQEALTLFRAVGARLGEANVLQAQGDVLAFLDQRDEALARYQEALTLFRAVGDRLGEANVLLALGDILRGQKEYDRAWERYVEVGRLYGAIGDRYSMARVLYRMGDWHAEQDQRQPAAELYRQAIDLWRSIGVDELVENILLPRLQVVT